MKVIRVITPSGVIADGVWEEEGQIPERLMDRFGFTFLTEETGRQAQNMSRAAYETEREKMRPQDR